MVATTDVASSESPMSTVASKPVKRPRTFEMPRWRTVKSTDECAGSTAQRPALSGRAVVSVVVMLPIVYLVCCARETGSILVLGGPG